jgi:hypothetical protein
MEYMKGIGSIKYGHVITNGSVEFGSDLTAAAECQANF